MIRENLVGESESSWRDSFHQVDTTVLLHVARKACYLTAVCIRSKKSLAQVLSAAKGGRINMSIGGGSIKGPIKTPGKYLMTNFGQDVLGSTFVVMYLLIHYIIHSLPFG